MKKQSDTTVDNFEDDSDDHSLPPPPPSETMKYAHDVINRVHNLDSQTLSPAKPQQNVAQDLKQQFHQRPLPPPSPYTSTPNTWKELKIKNQKVTSPTLGSSFADFYRKLEVSFDFFVSC